MNRKATARAVSASLATAGLLWVSAASAQIPGILEFNLAIQNRAITIATVANGDVPVLRLRQGQTAEFIWSSDELTQLHLHGYDLGLDIDPQTGGSLKFKATVAGRFAFEVHRFGGRLLAGVDENHDDEAEADRSDDQASRNDQVADQLAALADGLVDQVLQATGVDPAQAEARAAAAHGPGNGPLDEDEARLPPSNVESIILYIEVLPR